jgi:type I restriction enzyme S subunit
MGDRDNLPELPNGWVWVQLISLCTAIGDVDHKMPKAQEKGIPYVSTKDFLQNGQINFEDAKKVAEEDYQRLCRKIFPERGDILLSRYGTVGEVRLIQTDLSFQASYSIAIIKPVLHQVNKFIAAALQSEPVQAQIKKYVRGVAQPDLGLAHIRELALPFAPLAEQERILSKIEELFSELDAGVELLKKLKAKLKRYRQAVLKAAVEGKLTKDWREAHQGELEPASVLLERILKERREKWEAEQLAQMKAKGKTPKDDSWKLKYKEPVAPDTSDLPELPEGWVWATVEQLASFAANSITDGPFGSNLKTSHYTSTGPRVIRLQNIGDGVFIDEHSHISQKHFDSLVKHHIKAGDIVIAVLGEQLPRACIIPSSVGLALVKADCIRFSPHPQLAFAQYLNYALNAKPTRTRTASIVHGVGRPRLNLGEVKSIVLPLPSISEQKEIIEDVERYLSIANQIEKVVDKNLKRAEKLRQSILKKAFEGKLVPQDPTDEPADKLLERIKAEKAKREAEAKAKKKRKQPGKSEQLELF